MSSQLQTSLTSAMYGGEYSALHARRLNPGQKARGTEAGWTPEWVWTLLKREIYRPCRKPAVQPVV